MKKGVLVVYQHAFYFFISLVEFCLKVRDNRSKFQSNIHHVKHQTFFLPPTPTLTIVNLRYKKHESPLCLLYKKEPNSVKYRSKSEPRTDLHRVWLFGSTEDYLTYLFASFRFAIARLRSAWVTRP